MISDSQDKLKKIKVTSTVSVQKTNFLSKQEKGEFNKMSYHYMKEESIMPSYFQFPVFLMELLLSQTARITYMIL